MNGKTKPRGFSSISCAYRRLMIPYIRYWSRLYSSSGNLQNHTKSVRLALCAGPIPCAPRSVLCQSRGQMVLRDSALTCVVCRNVMSSPTYTFMLQLWPKLWLTRSVLPLHGPAEACVSSTAGPCTFTHGGSFSRNPRGLNSFFNHAWLETLTSSGSVLCHV